MWVWLRVFIIVSPLSRHLWGGNAELDSSRSWKIHCLTPKRPKENQRIDLKKNGNFTRIYRIFFYHRRFCWCWEDNEIGEYWFGLLEILNVRRIVSREMNSGLLHFVWLHWFGEIVSKAKGKYFITLLKDLLIIIQNLMMCCISAEYS